MATETSTTSAARKALLVGCPKAVIRKLNDRSTVGLPDTVITWNLNTSWLEFKHLDANEPLHAPKPDSTRGLKRVQLMELVDLERQSHRAWVVVYRRRGKLQVFRPTALLTVQAGELTRVEPRASKVSTHESILLDLRAYGVAEFASHDHGALVALIRWTHGTTY